MFYYNIIHNNEINVPPEWYSSSLSSRPGKYYDTSFMSILRN